LSDKAAVAEVHESVESTIPAQGLDYKGLKRVIDICLSLSALTLCLPLIGLIALLVRLDAPGSILFRQSRGGFAGKTFQILKFRTLTVLEDGPDVIQVQEGDPRITRVGNFLRKFHLDELPQIFNVLFGDMSFVGPRPHAVAHDIYYGSRIPNYCRRSWVKPGITGWAQINGARGPTPLLSDMSSRIELDIWYVEHACFTLDILILIRTPLAILRPKSRKSLFRPDNHITGSFG
jgi:putative colanic acid biosynthesis UDP-glucose lipid carrier transferase